MKGVGSRLRCKRYADPFLGLFLIGTVSRLDLSTKFVKYWFSSVLNCSISILFHPIWLKIGNLDTRTVDPDQDAIGSARIRIQEGKNLMERHALE